MARKLTRLLLLVMLLSACAAPAASGPSIRVEAAWARPAALVEMPAGEATTAPMDMPGMTTAVPMTGMGGATSAVYFTIRNSGGQADTLTGVTSDIAAHTSVHETQVDQQGVAKMVPVTRLEIPAGGSVAFKPGGYHVMLEGLKQDLKVGDSIQIALQFEKSGTITVSAAVRQP